MLLLTSDTPLLACSCLTHLLNPEQLRKSDSKGQRPNQFASDYSASLNELMNHCLRHESLVTDRRTPDPLNYSHALHPRRDCILSASLLQAASY